MFQSDKILDAATDAIIRYGVKRVRMSDVAAQADVSRQTVYASYKTKDDLLRAVIAQWTRRMAHEVSQAWARATTLGAKLDIYFNHAVAQPFEVMTKMPDSRDVILGTDPVTVDAIRSADAIKRKLLCQLFAPYHLQIEAHGQSVEHYASFVQLSGMGLKSAASDIRQLNMLLASLKASVLAVCTDG